MGRLKRLLLFTALVIIAGCAGGHKAEQKRLPTARPPVTPQLPQPVPTVPEAKIQISVAHPPPGMYKPHVDSNFIFGTVGNGHAILTINGYDVPVAKNGAFLAFLPMPYDGVYHLEAEREDDRDSATVSYRTTSAYESHEGESTPRAEMEVYPSPRWARVVRGSDTLQTGNDVAPGAPTPEADRKWFFPRGSEVQVAAREGRFYKVRLDKQTVAYVADTNLELASKPQRVPDKTGIFPSDGYVDVVLPGDYNAFLITADGNSLAITIYGRTANPQITESTTDPLINNIGFNVDGENTDYTLLLSKPVWGYKAFYHSDGALVIRLRRPPTIDPANPLKGIRIMLDPGHPPGGAIGPTGLTEREANLAEALRVRDQLQSRGADVLMTHTTLEGLVSSTNQVEELDARAALAVRDNVDLMVSLHNNAFPDGTDPFLNYGTSTYYFNSFSAGLAAALDHEIAQVTGIPNLGSFHKSLAICRPTWMPCALTESLYMMFPDQEQALRDPKFLDQLAAAHVRGIEDFLRQHVP